MNEHEKMKQKIVKALTRVNIPRHVASSYFDSIEDQLISKELNKMTYKEIRKMFWDDVKYPWEEGY